MFSWSSRLQQWVVRVPVAVRDVMAVVSVVAVDLYLWSDIALPARDGKWSTALWILGLAALNLLILLERRRFPVAVLLALGCISVITATRTGFTYSPVLEVCLALGTVASQRRVNWAVAGVLLAVVTSVTWAQKDIRTDPSASPSDLPVILFAFTVLLLGAAGLGRWARAAREKVRLLDERRQADARQAVVDERLRLAREMHDIVSHAVTVMVLQASGARQVLPTDPLLADGAMAAVEEAGRRAMTELRRLLGVLRGDRDGEYEEPSVRGGLADIGSLIDTARATGLDVDVQTEGERRTFDASVDLAAFRVVQEGLTNAAKHGGPGCKVTLRLMWTDESLAIELTDDGAGFPGAPGLSAGHGLLGLRERIIVVGGELSTRPLDRGFELRAVLPVSEAHRSVVHLESP